MSGKAGQLVDADVAAAELLKQADHDVKIVEEVVGVEAKLIDGKRPPLTDRGGTYGAKVEHR